MRYSIFMLINLWKMFGSDEVSSRKKLLLAFRRARESGDSFQADFASFLFLDDFSSLFSSASIPA